MLEKKLLTLGCVAGILLCGACFLPPPRQTLPPLAVDLSGSSRILVRVTNISETRHVDPVVLGRLIAREIDDERPAGAPRAFVGDESQHDDTVLQISIAKESAGSEASAGATTGQMSTFVQLAINASLTKPDGVVVWHEVNQQYRSNGRGQWAADPWSSPAFTNWLRYYVAVRLVSHFLFGARW